MRRGPLLMVIAAGAFTAMLAFVKIAREELPASEVIAYRAVLGLPMVWLFARRGSLSIQQRGALAARVGFGFAAMFCYFSAAKGLGVADLSLITKLQPILVAIIAPLALGASERSGARIWLALAAGLAGCAILLAPQLDVGSTFGLWALAAALLSAIAHTSLRKLSKTEQPLTVVFWFLVGLSVLSVPATFIEAGGVPPLPRIGLWPVLLGCAASASIGQVLLTFAYRADPAPVVAAASYTAPVWALAVDLVWFGLWPSRQVLGGGALIVGAGLWLVLHERDESALASARRPPS
ncbi:MAG: DMT family transporter [Deltaproteobacteria bacterium]|jgi:drug/metabolite transporter (DMT)-like permease|nr:DMT family transporter [Deltaproteobacteria bacterium]MBW2534468.1 DMT family transporter [Deltaproteobacteria bacterium]